jgi:hypothetical protein
MFHLCAAAALLCVCALLRPPPAFAHAVCGSRVYPVTLTMDDPGVADEITVPQVVYTRTAAGGGAGPGHDTSLLLEYDKRLTDEIGFAFNEGWNINQTDGAKTQYGWDDLTITAKWSKCLSPDHDFILAVGVIREFGHTGTLHTGADVYGNTVPTVYFGKDLEEVALPALQPVAITGEFSYVLEDKGLKYQPAFPAATQSGLSPQAQPAPLQLNNGNPNQVSASFSVQYSIPFLQAQIKDYGLPEPFAHLIPLVETNYTGTTTSPGAPSTWTVAVGTIYLRTWYQVGLEALIPANKAAGTNVGVLAQFHVFLDDLYPNSIGAPLLSYFK